MLLVREQAQRGWGDSVRSYVERGSRTKPTHSCLRSRPPCGCALGGRVALQLGMEEGASQ